MKQLLNNNNIIDINNNNLNIINKLWILKDKLIIVIQLKVVAVFSIYIYKDNNNNNI